MLIPGRGPILHVTQSTVKIQTRQKQKEFTISLQFFPPFPLLWGKDGIQSTFAAVVGQSLSWTDFCDPMDHSPPGSSVHGLFQARILEWVAISSRGSCILCVFFFFFNITWITSYFLFFSVLFSIQVYQMISHDQIYQKYVWFICFRFQLFVPLILIDRILFLIMYNINMLPKVQAVLKICSEKCYTVPSDVTNLIFFCFFFFSFGVSLFAKTSKHFMFSYFFFLIQNVVYCKCFSFSNIFQKPLYQLIKVFPILFYSSIFLLHCMYITGASLLAQRIKHLPAMQEIRVQSLGWEDPLEKEMATHSSILAWRIPWTEEPGGLQSTGSQRVGNN